ncbi:MAG: lipoyl synthase [Nitrospirota bacterium]|nr:lipoyl synthase [Nitrospirota bacterium]
MPLPPWFKINPIENDAYRAVASTIAAEGLHTVCQSSGCPNRWECWGSGTATFLILGNVCTRNCAFCGIPGGKPEDVDPHEPERVAAAVKQLSIRHAVITSVTRDDLPDGGARIFALTVAAIRETIPSCTVELLTPDFMGDDAAIDTVINSKPDVFGHNVETVQRLYRQVRPGAAYERSLHLLQKVSRAGLTAKSGLILGMGETTSEVMTVLQDLISVGCRSLTIGQYLNPGGQGHPVARFVPPEEFDELQDAALSLGFAKVVSGPLVRSSYKASIR